MQYIHYILSGASIGNTNNPYKKQSRNIVAIIYIYSATVKSIIRTTWGLRPQVVKNIQNGKVVGLKWKKVKKQEGTCKLV